MLSTRESTAEEEAAYEAATMIQRRHRARMVRKTTDNLLSMSKVRAAKRMSGSTEVLDLFIEPNVGLELSVRYPADARLPLSDAGAGAGGGGYAGSPTKQVSGVGD